MPGNIIRPELELMPLSGDLERDVAMLHEYLVKLQDMLRFNLANLQVRNFNARTLPKLFSESQLDFNSSDGRERATIRVFDNGIYLGTALSRKEPRYSPKTGDAGAFLEFSTGYIYSVKDGMTRIGG